MGKIDKIFVLLHKIKKYCTSKSRWEMLNNGKATIESKGDTISVSVPADRNLFILILNTIFMWGWGWGFKVALTGLVNFEIEQQEGRTFVTFWLLLWTITGLLIIRFILWGFFGRETFRLSPTNAELSKMVFGIGKKNSFDTKELKNLRFQAVDTGLNYQMINWRAWGVGRFPGKIQFDYGMRTYSFGAGVDDAEAKYIISEIQKIKNF